MTAMQGLPISERHGREGYLVGLPDGGGGPRAVVGLAGDVPGRGQAAGRQQQHAGQQRQQRHIDGAEAVVADHHAAEARAEGEGEGARDELHGSSETSLPSQPAGKVCVSCASADAAPGVLKQLAQWVCTSHFTTEDRDTGCPLQVLLKCLQ